MSGGIDFLAIDMEDSSMSNSLFRYVIYTDDNIQIALMSLLPGQDIDMEIHQGVTQFIRVEFGKGKAIIGNNEVELSNGTAITVPPGTAHKIANTSRDIPMKIYTIYSPPVHDPFDIQEIEPLY